MSKILAHITYQGNTFATDFSQPLDISIPLGREKSPNAFYLDPIKYTTVEAGSFVGNVKRGGSCNCEDISFNPHGNGTHTECAGHVAAEPIFINDALKEFFHLAHLVTIAPEPAGGGNIISLESLSAVLPKNAESAKALIIRTKPNNADKLARNYSGANAPYMDEEAMAYVNSLGIEHLLTDLPSVDKEDDPELLAHHVFFTHPQKWNLHKTITEMIYVPDFIEDGLYWLNLQIASFESDASPSKPILYETRLVGK